MVIFMAKHFLLLKRKCKMLADILWYPDEENVIFFWWWYSSLNTPEYVLKKTIFSVYCQKLDVWKKSWARDIWPQSSQSRLFSCISFGFSILSVELFIIEKNLST